MRMSRSNLIEFDVVGLAVDWLPMLHQHVERTIRARGGWWDRAAGFASRSCGRQPQWCDDAGDRVRALPGVSLEPASTLDVKTEMRPCTTSKL